MNKVLPVLQLAADNLLNNLGKEDDKLEIESFLNYLRFGLGMPYPKCREVFMKKEIVNSAEDFECLMQELELEGKRT